MLCGVSKKVIKLIFLAHKGIQKAILKVTDQAGTIGIILDYSLSSYLYLKLLTKISNHFPNC